MDLYQAARVGDLKRVQELVEKGADMEKTDSYSWTPLLIASRHDNLEVVQHLLEQGANVDKANDGGYTPLHWAASRGQLEIAKLLMLYGADLNARSNSGTLPINLTINEKIKQAIRDEPERRRDQQPRKRCIEEGLHSNATASASAQQEDDEEEQINKQPAEGKTEVGEVADEDQDSEPSSDEDD